MCFWQASTYLCGGRPRVQGAQFAVSEVEVVSATVDLDEVVSYRGGIASLQQQVCSHMNLCRAVLHKGGSA